MTRKPLFDPLKQREKGEGFHEDNEYDMRFMVRIISFFCLTVLIQTASPVWAAETLVKIANVGAWVMDEYSKTEESFFKHRDTFFDGLEQVLNPGEGSGGRPDDNRSIPPNTVLQKNVREIRAEIKTLFPFMGRVAGRQLPAAGSGWNKFIVAFNDGEGRGNYLFEAAEEDALGNEEVARIAVKNKEGRLESREISESLAEGDAAKTVYRVKQAYFLKQLRQGNFLKWFQNVVPRSNGVGMMIVRQDYEQGLGDKSDMVLIWIYPEQLPNNTGPSDATIVIGWKNRGILQGRR